MLVGVFDLIWLIIEGIAKLAIKLFNYLKNTKTHSTIRAAEAYRDETGVMTVVNKKRNIGFITLRHSTLRKEDFWNIVNSKGLKTLSVPLNPNDCYIYYIPGHEKQAQELKDIADKYNGYLAYWATKEDTRRIGELLQYDPKDIEEFINKE